MLSFYCGPGWESSHKSQLIEKKMNCSSQSYSHLVQFFQNGIKKSYEIFKYVFLIQMIRNEVTWQDRKRET